jgi:hypothetical protein
MMAYNRTGDLVPLILNLGTWKRRVGSCLSRWLYTRRKSSWRTLMSRLVGPQSQCRFLETKEISRPLLSFEPQIMWSLTKPLYWLLYWLCLLGIPLVINNTSRINLISPYDILCYHVGKWYQSSAVHAVSELVRCHAFRHCSVVYSKLLFFIFLGDFVLCLGNKYRQYTRILCFCTMDCNTIIKFKPINCNLF